MRQYQSHWQLHILAQCSWRFILAMLLLLTVPENHLEAADADSASVKVRFSRSLFEEVNENDALAAMKAWGIALAYNKNMPVKAEPSIFEGIEDLRKALHEQTIDIVTTSILEYEALQKELSSDEIFISLKGEEASEEYLLIAHRNGPIKNLQDLAGRHVLLQQNVHLYLAPLWLDTLLVRKGLKPVESFADTVVRKNALSDVLLPVFFQQADACVVNRRGLETMVELNPQLGRQLVVVESSSKLVPAVFALRRGYSPPYKEALLDGFRKLHESADGRQVLLIFKSNKLAETSKDFLEPSLELITAYRQLAGE